MTEAVALALLALDILVGAAVIFILLSLLWWAAKRSIRALGRGGPT